MSNKKRKLILPKIRLETINWRDQKDGMNPVKVDK